MICNNLYNENGLGGVKICGITDKCFWKEKGTNICNKVDTINEVFIDNGIEQQKIGELDLNNPIKFILDTQLEDNYQVPITISKRYFKANPCNVIEWKKLSYDNKPAILHMVFIKIKTNNMLYIGNIDLEEDVFYVRLIYEGHSFPPSLIQFNEVEYWAEIPEFPSE